MRLLLVEDERQLAEHLSRGLREEGYAVDAAVTASSAQRLAIENPYDLVVLDVMLPDGSGLQLLRGWREEGSSVPVLMLTARDRLDDRVEGLDAGADDYLTKPFAFAELLARLRALGRRQQVPVRVLLQMGNVELDRGARRVRVAGRPVELAAKELALLEQLLLRPGAVLSRAEIGAHAWDDRFEPRSNVIDVLLSRVRRKLQAAGATVRIRAVPNLGYGVEPEE
jgi:DNA-binding response OmpR family regulator